MQEQRTFELADKAFLKVVKQIKDNQWSMPLPDWFQRGKSQDYQTLRSIITYHAYDEAWIPDMLDGKTMDEAGEMKFDGNLLEDDPIGRFSELVDKSIKAVEALDNPAKIVHCSFGDFTAREYLWQANSFRGFRAYDIAKLIGIKPELPEELVQGLWDQLSPRFEEWREMGIFLPAVPVPDDSNLLTRLLGASGRQP